MFSQSAYRRESKNTPATEGLFVTQNADNYGLLDDSHLLDAITQIATETPLVDVLGEMAMAMQRQSPGAYCVFLALLDGAVEPIAPSLPADTVEGIRRSAFRIVSKLNEAGFIDREFIVLSVAEAVNAEEVVRSARDLDLHGAWCAPIRSTRGDCLGALMVWNRQTRMPSPAEGQAFALIRRLAAVAIEHRQLCSAMSHQAIHDPLTGLPNHLLLEHDLNRAALTAIQADRQVSLLLVNLDNFRSVNEALGHETGDAVLVEAARRIGRCLGDNDFAGRMSGDEFGVVIEGSDIAAMARRILSEFVAPITVGKRELFMSATIGAATGPQHGRQAMSLRRNADAALCRAKQDSRGAYLIYMDSMNAGVRERVDLAGDLRYAMQRDELELHYQPQVTADGTLFGFEALLRWRHPIHGYISPAKFVPIAEETGLILSIGQWVIRTAVEQCKVWQSAGRPDLRMAVNVSAMQLAQDDFVDQTLAIITESGISPDSIELELTESLLVGDSIDVTRKLYALRDAGLRTAVDDFGTGYSSLAYLQQLPIDTLKIDRAFVSMIDSPSPAASSRTAIVRAILSMARELNLTVTAEGVETAEQQRFLQELGCQQLQGYYFGKPQPAEPAMRMLRAAIVAA